MFCQYCLALNPDDAVYCCKCGHIITSTDDTDARDTQTSEYSESDFAEEPASETFARDYECMDKEELTQLQGAYRKLQLPLPPSLHDELELRDLMQRVEALEERPEGSETPSPHEVSNDLQGEEFDDGQPIPRAEPKGGWAESLKRQTTSMNRSQRACLWVGFLLLVGATLFPHWTYSYRSSSSGLPRLPRLPTLGGSRSDSSPASSYGFLFHPPSGGARVDLNRLFVEWVLIVLVVSGFFLSQAKHPTLKSEALAAAGPSSMKGQSFFKLGKLWQRKFIIPIVVALTILTISLGYYGSRRIVRNLPTTEDSKLAGQAYITNYGRFVWNAYNGSDFVLTEVRVSISVFDEKGNALISHRVYRVPAYDFYPQQVKELSTDVGFTLGESQTWGWNVVEAKGRPE